MRYPLYRLFYAGRFAVGLTVFAAVTLCPSPSEAGGQRPCSYPAVFPGAVVNSIVLPYRYTGAHPTPEVERSSKEIAGLVHYEILLSLLKYGSIGATNLVEEPGRICNVEQVITQVSHPGSESLRPGHMLVVAWGRLFEQNDQLFIQSYLRFLQEGTGDWIREKISVTLKSGEKSFDLIATLPTQGIAFAPRKIAKNDLARVAETFRKTMEVRPEPNLNLPGKSIDFEPERIFSYWVTEALGEWIHIKPMMEGPAGWVHARTGNGDSPSDWSLRRWLPELAYIDAIAGFMRLRARERGNAQWVANVRKSVENGFAQFEQSVPEQDASVAYGLARAIQGFMALEFEEPAAGAAKATPLFAEARRLMPDYSAAQNLAAVSRLLPKQGNVDEDAAKQLGRELAGALGLDPTDASVLRNLERVYTLYAERPEWNTYEKAELNRRISVVQDAWAKAPRKQ
jgi:hypothetical protein